MPTTAAIINSQTELFNAGMVSVIRKLSNYLNSGIKLTTEAGLIVPTVDNFENIAIVSGELLEQLEKSGYYNLIREFSQNNTDFTAQQIKEMGKRFQGADTYLGAIEGTTLSGLQNMQYEGMAVLGQSRIGAISQVLYDSVLAGTSNAVLTGNLKSQLGNLSRYSETYLRTAKREYSQQTEFEIAKAAGIDRDETIWEYIGAPLQDNSHAECVWALLDKPHAPFFTTAEMEEFQAGGGYDHMEPRWNCQHIFGITDLTIEEYENV